MNYDVLVIGGGHAGVEAAVMARRLKMKVAIVTFSANDIGVCLATLRWEVLAKVILYEKLMQWEGLWD